MKDNKNIDVMTSDQSKIDITSAQQLPNIDENESSQNKIKEGNSAPLILDSIKEKDINPISNKSIVVSSSESLPLEPMSVECEIQAINFSQTNLEPEKTVSDLSENNLESISFISIESPTQNNELKQPIDSLRSYEIHRETAHDSVENHTASITVDSEVKETSGLSGTFIDQGSFSQTSPYKRKSNPSKPAGHKTNRSQSKKKSKSGGKKSSQEKPRTGDTDLTNASVQEEQLRSVFRDEIDKFFTERVLQSPLGQQFHLLPMVTFIILEKVEQLLSPIMQIIQNKDYAKDEPKEENLSRNENELQKIETLISSLTEHVDSVSKNFSTDLVNVKENFSKQIENFQKQHHSHHETIRQLITSNQRAGLVSSFSGNNTPDRLLKRFNELKVQHFNRFARNVAKMHQSSGKSSRSEIEIKNFLVQCLFIKISDYSEMCKQLQLSGCPDLEQDLNELIRLSQSLVSDIQKAHPPFSLLLQPGSGTPFDPHYHEAEQGCPHDPSNTTVEYILFPGFLQETPITIHHKMRVFTAQSVLT